MFAQTSRNRTEPLLPRRMSGSGRQAMPARRLCAPLPVLVAIRTASLRYDAFVADPTQLAQQNQSSPGHTDRYVRPETPARSSGHVM